MAAVRPCTPISSALNSSLVTSLITFNDLAARPVDDIKGIGPKKLAGLAEMGVTTVADLVAYYPRRWLDRTNEARIRDLIPGNEALVLVDIRSVTKRITRQRKTIITARVGDGSGQMSISFFNQPWREKQLREGMTVALFGKADVFQGGLQMTNPIVDVIGDRTGKIVPIYPQSEKSGLATWEIAGWVEQALNRCKPRGLADPVPSAILGRFGLIDRQSALFAIHAPETMAAKEQARRRLAFDELLRVQLILVLRKRALERDSLGIRHKVGGELVRRFHAALPYGLTGAQTRVIAEIDNDLAGPHPMHRLLQGDVGSGKTTVAVSALLAAVQAGHQGALMAPTEVLAEQHYVGMARLLAGLEVPEPGNLFGDRPLRVAMLTNKVTVAERRETMAGLADGTIDLVVGTHALIQDAVVFKSLGVVVVDEQHRFGVEQRAMLRTKGEQGLSGTVPDVLVMTATPIPRTAAMTVYGDLDVSVLDEMPPGRTPIKTMWADGPLMEEAVWADVQAAVSAGQQAFVVCPLIEESEKLEVASAEETFHRLCLVDLRGLRLGLLHGRLAPAEKTETMDRFRRGELDVLVATTVIEVGVDVPNATVMVILDADRFGIAQLHQLRGRVGRGKVASLCWLVTGEKDEGAPEGNPRVEALVASTDGFELAEVDLDLRGEGTIMNTAQKGRSDLKLASLRRDRELVTKAREAAFAIVDSDPLLKKNKALYDELSLFFAAQDEAFLFKS